MECLLCVRHQGYRGKGNRHPDLTELTFRVWVQKVIHKSRLIADGEGH